MAGWELERPHPGWAELYLNRPERLNAIRAEDLRELERRWEELEADPELRVVLVGGRGRTFSAGADLLDLAQHAEGVGPWTLSRLGQAVLSRIAQSPLLSMAVIGGHALGGGLELALACDFRLAAASARLALPEVRLGLIPGFGGTQRLPRLVGASRALWLMAAGSPVSGEEAAALGLVDWVVPADGLWPAARERARVLAEQPPLALRALKALVQGADPAALEPGLRQEADRFQALIDTPLARERVQAFLARRRRAE
ncbi:MAG: enoyl-CoA hydratase/isomerase family protein [Firmicutes bacterium]|nr:enoyl-CoA hydratase/isomerase family protein [Alicyclobacillaceae bacterium]MCL6497153.1 enoyl-CoA hydratase/isomerase family protein [Bacillota bacterium]